MFEFTVRNNLRRIARHDEQQFSKDSIVNVMEKFVKTVSSMDETILVPCRLMDRQVGDSTDTIQPKPSTSQQLTQQGLKTKKKTVHEALNSADLFNLYNMLNAVKNDFLWTDNSDHSEDDEGVERISNLLEPTMSSTTAPSNKGHNRTPSLASMTSTNSVSNLSDSDSELSNENDSGVESEGGNCGGSENSNQKQQNVDKATDLARQCRKHLTGLYRCLEQMTDAANYLTDRYQNEIGPV